MLARLLSDYALTLVGELECGAPDTLRTHAGAFWYALRRALYALTDSNDLNCAECGKLCHAHEPGCPVPPGEVEAW